MKQIKVDNMEEIENWDIRKRMFGRESKEVFRHGRSEVVAIVKSLVA